MSSRRRYAGAVNARPPTPAMIATGVWHVIQWHVHFAPDDTGFIRF
jgi:hypothetical protein